jgi:hypothetical protein
MQEATNTLKDVLNLVRFLLNNYNILKRCPTDLTSIKQAAKQ